MSTDEAPTITEFLLARIAEDEREANGHLGAEYYQDGLWPEECAARVLAECTAKRAIVAQAEEASMDRSQVIGEFCVGKEERDREYATDPGKLILEALAAVYSDHPDYRQWAA